MNTSRAMQELVKGSYPNFIIKMSYSPEYEHSGALRGSYELDLGVVLVLHDINMAARYCDRLVALREGALLRQGTPEELMTSATLADIYQLPMRVLAHPVTGEPVSVVL